MKSSRYAALGLATLVAGLGGWFVWSKTRDLPPSADSAAAVMVKDDPANLFPVSSRVLALLSDEPIAIAHRKNILRTLGDTLSHTDQIALLDSITAPPPNGVTEREWPSLANDILQILRYQRPSMPEYTDRVVAMWLDKDFDPTLRDYALQQLREWVADKAIRSMHEERPDKLALIRDTFLDACTPGHPYCDPQSTSTGTALLALEEWGHDTAPKAVRIAPEDIDRLLLAFAADESFHRGIRATALQLGVKRGLTDVLPLARQLAATPSTDLILRLAAISCLGTLGDADDLHALEDISRSIGADPLTRAALSSAIDRHSSQR